MSKALLSPVHQLVIPAGASTHWPKAEIEHAANSTTTKRKLCEFFIEPPTTTPPPIAYRVVSISKLYLDVPLYRRLKGRKCLPQYTEVEESYYFGANFRVQPSWVSSDHSR